LRFSVICRESRTNQNLLDLDLVGAQKDAMEPTPAPPPLAPQPPRGNWWQRNWKWFVPTGCLTLIAVVVLFVACIVILVFSVVKSSDAYKIAVARAKSDQRVVAALGTPIKEGMFSSGKTNVNGPSGEADIGIPISGPKGKATIYVVATKSEGQWSFSKLDVKIEGTGETIDLNETESASNEEGPATKKGAADTNVEVESITLAREEGDELKPVKNFKRADNPEHILVTLSEGNSGAHVKTVWTNLNAAGANNQKLWEKELVLDMPNPRADFSLSNTNSKLFPPGEYKIDIYLNDTLIDTVRYKVQ
jgi:Cytochrome oxidase complex assembly protein 1